MKAEQRKELETNALADRMGHLMQRMKTQPRRSTIYYVLGAVAIVVVLFVIYRTVATSRQHNSQNWFMVEQGTDRDLAQLLKDSRDTNPGKAAQFQVAWYLYWDAGVKRLGVGDGGMSALQRLEEAALEYEKLAKECSGDKLWEPEAMYGLAVIEETKAVVNLDALDRAKRLYEDLKAKYPDTARGKLAEEWLTNAENKEKYQQLRDFYQDLHTSLNIRDLNALKNRLNPKDLLPPKKDTK
jgi:hypothetical protein